MGCLPWLLLSGYPHKGQRAGQEPGLRKRRPLGWNSARSGGQTPRAKGGVGGGPWRQGVWVQQAARLTHAHPPPLSTPASQSSGEETEAGGVRPSQGHPATGHLLLDPCALARGRPTVFPNSITPGPPFLFCPPPSSPDLTGPPAVGSPGPLTSRVSVPDQGGVLWAITRPSSGSRRSEARQPGAWTHGPSASPRETRARYSLL